ncbi:recombinase family protein [Methylobacterium sp. Leaf106]|uniref:recombinase family protein n=1 Tax=Methylobacterium sp. Leaf106 TaxID=1736255 RepID=UPI0006F4C28F|nr:recombinase family protein [Methylobacterium sp. Leaf106]KQP44018.1 resolvase [Methylobacterium sp. Leaf106]
MATGKYVAYYRVSTGKQGRSGLGLDAQEQTVRDRLNGGDWVLVGEFKEIESGRISHRPELAKALAFCRVMGAKLIVANVSRLTRNPDFMSTLVAADVEVEFCDLPNVEGPVGKFMLRQMLSVAELEAGMIAERTRKALAAAKARGKVLGGDRGNLSSDNVRGRAVSLKVRQDQAVRRQSDLMPIIQEIQGNGAQSLRAIAVALNERGIPAVRGGAWSASQVKRLLDEQGKSEIRHPFLSSIP